MVLWAKEKRLFNQDNLIYEDECHLKDQGRWQWLHHQSVHIETLEIFLIPSIENWFDDKEVIFQDNDGN